MQHLFRILLILLAVTGLRLSIVEAGNPVTAGLSHKYSIYCSSEEDSTALNTLYGSYLHFQLKPGVGATYDYFIKDDMHVSGRVENYQETENGMEYVLGGFFDGKYNARLTIIDMENCDNMKIAIALYANAWEDKAGSTTQQMILIDGEYDANMQNLTLTQ